ncbi:50S ribosomal protein L31e [Candidatus Bathyarchaeota archaeon]|nr:50S ribosomal protein L31e [Candidatus Bathyarchaeota archaeon]
MQLSEERIYTVPLGRAWVAKNNKLTVRAVKVLKKFVQRHMKPTDIIIDTTVNEALWANGIRNPPRKIRVRLEKDDDGVVTVFLAEEEQ